MEKLRMNLQHFDDPATYTVTCYKDANITTFSASPASGAKDTEVTLTITPASNKELDELEVIAGGVTVNMTTKKFTIGEANVVLYAKGKSSKKYMVTENTPIIINGTKTELKRNMTLDIGKTGAVIGVTCDGTEITMNDAVQNLIDTGVIIKI